MFTGQMRWKRVPLNVLFMRPQESGTVLAILMGQQWFLIGSLQKMLGLFPKKPYPIRSDIFMEAGKVYINQSFF